MKSILLYVFLSITLACSSNKKDVEYQKEAGAISHKFSIEILDQEALSIIDPNTHIEVLASGFTWTEGPLWVDEKSFYLFSDIPNNKVYKLDSKGDTSTYLHPSGTSDTIKNNEPGSNGLLLNNTNELILMQHGDRRVSKMNAPLSNPQEKYTPLVKKYQDKRLNSPNDGVIDRQGNIYFTDPPYGLPKKLKDPNKELSFQGVYCLLTNGELLLIDTLTYPNGIGLSPDGTSLYVAVSDPQHAVWYQYNIESPGKTSNKKIFYDVTPLVKQGNQHGLPDGLTINSQGYIFATGPGGVWLFNSTAKPIARIFTGQLTSNCALGKDEKELFMTADDYILSLNLK